jgi:hypothetical protein
MTQQTPNLDAFSKEMREKLAKVDFGMQVQVFLRSKIGTYLVDRAQSEVEEKTSRLKQHPILKDPEGAAQLQQEINTAENVLYWLAEAVKEGALLMEQMLAEERSASGLGADGQGGDPTGT